MSSAGVCVFMALVTSNLELLAALRAGALRNSELAYTKLRHFWAQIVSWAPRHARKTFIVLAPGDLGSKTAKQLYNSYQICSDHFEDSQYMDPAHTSLMPHAISIDFMMKAETIKLYWNRPDFTLDDHVWQQHVVVLSPSAQDKETAGCKLLCQ